MEVTVHKHVTRMGSGLAAAALIALSLAGPATAGTTSKAVSVVGTSEGVLASFMVSAGESAPVSVTITNNGNQTLNNVTLLFGQDDSIVTAPNGDATPPTNLPAGITVATSTTGCSGGSILSCSLGSLRSGRSVTVNATVNSSAAASATSFLTEAVVGVAESGRDNGANVDTFSAQGTIDILAFSCESTTAYRPGSSSKEVSTCAIGVAGNDNNQSAKVKLPSNLSIVTLSEVAGQACPVITGLTCIGEEVDAFVTGDTSADVITWTISVKLNGANVSTGKIVVVHTTNEGVSTPIALKRNACKTASSVNCGVATIANDILTVTIQTPGNGKTRLLG